MDYELIRNIRNRDNAFAVLLGIETTELGEDYARGQMRIKDEWRNLNKSVHGGCLATLADTIGGSAASAQGYRVATASSQISYLAPALDTEWLYCTAKVVKEGKKLIVCEIKIYSDTDKLLLIGLSEFAKLKDKYE